VNCRYTCMCFQVEDLIVPERASGVRAGRPRSDGGDYQPIDFSSLPVGPNFDLVDGSSPVLSSSSASCLSPGRL